VILSSNNFTFYNFEVEKGFWSTLRVMMNSVANDAIKLYVTHPPQVPRAFFIEILIKTRGSTHNDLLKNRPNDSARFCLPHRFLCFRQQDVLCRECL